MEAVEAWTAQHAMAYGHRAAARRNLGLVLRVERQRKRVSLRALAGRLKISPAMLSDLARGNRWSHTIAREAVEVLAAEAPHDA